MLHREQHFQEAQRGSHPEGAQDIVKTERNMATTVTEKKENRALMMKLMTSSTEREQYARDLNGDVKTVFIIRQLRPKHH